MRGGWKPDPKTTGYTAILRQENNLGDLPGYMKSGDVTIDTCTKLMANAAEKYPNNKCLGWRPWDGTPETRGNAAYATSNYKETWDEMQLVGKGLYELLKADGVNVGIYGANRPEWIISAFGNYSQKYRTVAVYNKWGADQVQYVLAHSEIEALFCEHGNLKTVVDYVSNIKKAGESLKLKYIIVWDHQEKYNNTHERLNLTDAEKQVHEELGLKVVSFSGLIENGRKSPRAVQHATKKDLAFIMYTSGTTSNPKGVLLKHGNLQATVSSVSRYVNPILGEGEQRPCASCLFPTSSSRLCTKSCLLAAATSDTSAKEHLRS